MTYLDPKIQGGLKKKKWDPRDFKFGQLSDYESRSNEPLEMPENFEYELKVKEQIEDLCTAYATTSASELQERVELNPYWQFAKIRELIGDMSWGADLRTACKSLVKFGSLPQTRYESGFKERDTIADWTKWPSELDADAYPHRKKSYFEVKGGAYEIKRAIWLSREKERAVITGAYWREDWLTDNYKGIIPYEYGKEGFPHAFAVTGWKTIEGVEFLVCHLSNGMIGSNGKFYMPFEVANKELKYGAYVLADLDPDIFKGQWSLIQKLFDIIKKLNI